MRPLSAAESIAPAFERTRAVLFHPLQLGRSWKLAATAYLAVAGSVFLPTPLALLIPHSHTSGVALNTAAGLAALAAFGALRILIGLIGTAILFAFFYVGARLQFARFDIVLRGERFIAPLWRRYAPFTTRWIALKLSLSLTAMLIFGLPLWLSLRRALAHAQVVPGQPISPHVLLGVLMTEGIFFLATALLMLVSSLCDDFLLPSIALEAVPLKEAFRRLAALIESEPGPFFFYVFLKTVLAFAIGIALYIAMVLIELIALVPFALIGLLGWLALHNLGPSGRILMAVGAAFLVLAAVVAIFYLVFFLVGTVVLFFQAYALYFLAGRYPLLGSILTPPPPPFAIPEPPPPHPAPLTDPSPA